MSTIYDLLVTAYTNWDDPKVLFRAGRDLHDRNRLDHARKVLARAVELDPKGEPDAWAYLAFAHLRDFEDEAGLKALRAGIEATDSMNLRATLMNFTGDDEERESMKKMVEEGGGTEAATAEAWGLVREGQVEEGMEKMRALVAEHPDDQDLEENFLWMFFSARHQEKADEEALKSEALPLVQKLVEREPDRTHGRWFQLQFNLMLEDWDGVLEATAAVLQRFPDEETFMQYRGRGYKEKGDLDRAVQWFSRAIGAKPSFAGARVDLGKAYEAKEQYDLAEEIFREIPVAHPDYAPGPVSLALYLARRGRFDEAEDIFLTALPDLPPWFLGGLKKNADAEALLEREKIKAALES